MNKIIAQILVWLRRATGYVNYKFNSMSEFSKRACVIVFGVIVATACVWITITSVIDYIK